MVQFGESSHLAGTPDERKPQLCIRIRVNRVHALRQRGDPRHLRSTPMATLSSRAFPSITKMIRLDHGHVTALFHRYSVGASTARKEALARNACLALEIHAQLEEEIFYPALANVAGNSEVLAKSKPEHDAMRQLIERLRTLTAGSPEFDQTFFSLMGAVLHHVADEESTLLPEAERMLADQLGDLGLQMTRRRMQLLAPHAGEAALTGARSFPLATVMLAAGALTLGTALFAALAGGSTPRRRDEIVRSVRSRAKELRPNILH